MMAALLWTANASAQVPPPAAPAGPTIAERSRGFAFIGSFGVDGCTDDWCNDVDPMVFLRVQLLFRIFKYAAVGLHTGFLFQHPDDPPGQDTDVLWNLILGGEIRGIIPWRKVDVWTGFVFAWSRWMWEGEAEILGQTYDLSQWMNGFALGWGFGADYFLGRTFAMGFNFYLYKPWYKKLCIKNGDKTCPDLDEPPLNAEDQIGIWWTVGFNLTFLLPF
jgi:hypothetical protein